MRIVAVFLCLLVPTILPDDGTAQVRLNEFLADPVTDWDEDGVVDSRGDEWVEIVNTGPSSVDLSRYRLGDLSGGSTWRFAFGGTLAPGAVRVVYGSEAVAWQVASGFPAFGLSLNNAGDTVFLYDVTDADTLVADQYAYEAFAVLDDRATGRNPDGDGPWEIFDALNPYEGSTPPLGNGCAPSPGQINECPDQLPVRESTWGAIKSLYSN